MAISTQYDLANDTRFVQVVSGALAGQVYSTLTGTPTPDDELLAGMCLRDPDLWARRFASLIAQADTAMTKANMEARLPTAVGIAWGLMIRAAKREEAIGNG